MSGGVGVKDPLFLTREELEAKSTQRLLAILKKFRTTNLSPEENLESVALENQILLVKQILAKREHLPKRGKK